MSDLVFLKRTNKFEQIYQKYLTIQIKYVIFALMSDLITLPKHEAPKVNLFYNYYTSEKRQHEIDECLYKNRLIFDQISIILERPTFEDLFQLSNDYPNDINCFCNSDIYFTDLSLLHTIKPNECFALTRWDIKDGKEVFLNRPDSQDAWIFRGKIKPIKADFTMGMWGCDNRLAHEIGNVGYQLKNPSRSIKIMHVHAVDDRNHERTPQNTVPGPYKTIEIT